jgi:hypothetical protein
MTTISSTSLVGANAVSPVQRLLDQQKAAAAASTTTTTDPKTGATTTKSTSYTDQDWYIKAKVAQLKGQIATYTNIPGLDPSGGIIDSLTKEVNDLVKKQQAKLKVSQDAAAAKQAELDKQTKQAALDAQHPSVDVMLQRAKNGANGETVTAYAPPDTSKGASDGKVMSADDMLAKARGSSVNTTA